MIAQNNTLYNFTSQCNHKGLQNIEIDLESATQVDSNIDRTEFEMCLLGSSIVNQCVYSANFYVQKLTGKSVSIETIVGIAKIAAVLRAVAEVFEIETLRNYEFVPRGENI
jgi:AhpD family alkylhydroperoxidase